ncbi:MAG TPA: DUF3592 domain-containing protein [Patescibacteria group bacterium]|nr:DUF3592 domain-containing protein [Patescibacteria group bacterium]
METEFPKLLAPLTQAFTQTGYIVVGLIFSVIGGAILLDFFAWKAKAEEVEGTIIGVRSNGRTYRPVFSYSLDGNMHEATSDTGSSSLKGKETGRVMQIYVRRRDLSVARPAKGMLWPVLGAAFFAPGAWLVHRAFNDYEVNGYTWATLAVLAIMSVNKFRSIMIPKSQRLSAETWRLQRRQAVLSEPLMTAEEIENSPAMQKQLRQARKHAAVAGPLMILLGAAALAGAFYFGSTTLSLMNEGVTAPGEVIQLAYESTGKSSGYHAIIRFRDEAGADHTFRDSFGANPALYEEGEKVTVMYRKDDPQNSAALDRGIFNWLVPGALALFGLLFLLGGIAQMPRQRDEAV